MTEKELLDKLKQSAEQIDPPESIAPEHISSLLKNRQKKHRPVFRKNFYFSAANAASAAAVLLLCTILSGVAFRTQQTAPKIIPGQEQTAAADTEGAWQSSKASEEMPASAPDTPLPKQNAGELYTVAKSYDQVYDRIDNYYSDYNAVAYGVMEDAVAESAGATADGSEGMADARNLYAEADTGAAMKKSESAAAKEAHSTTNLQTEGVDESDIIKTDGRYIYTVADRKIIVTDTSGNDLKPAGEIDPGLNSADSVSELYVDNDRLLLLVQHCDTKLEEDVSSDTSSSVSEEDADAGFLPLEDSSDTLETKKVRYMTSDYSTVLYVYDITDPSAPVLKGTGTQDGFYYTSRKIGDILYLFTQKDSLAEPAYYDGQKAEGGVIPCVNGKEIPYDHIYLPKTGGSGLLLSSFQVDKPEENIDEVMIVHNSVSIYVGTDSIYLYNADFTGMENMTQIAKFQMKDGIMNAVDAASIKGNIFDTFAINESGNTLRVLATSYDGSGNSSNHLYLFDENMKLVSSLDDIAKGEEIYAARYLGNTVYFITYRNTDPLFAVDISDINNPKLLGELKITGFSEYLHFWENNRLLGIGYETDPDSGRQKGLKLVMFDISDPTDLKAVDSIVLDKYYYSPALYNYKCVLADPGKNLIGFAAECNPNDYDYWTDYNVFSWENDHFTKKLNERLPDHISSDSVRGIYIGDRFYIAGLTEIVGFDIKNGFKKQWQLNLTK